MVLLVAAGRHYSANGSLASYWMLGNYSFHTRSTDVH